MPITPPAGTYSDWMAGFSDRDDLTLCDITFPASHDAGLSHAPGGFIPYAVGGADSTICQYYNIGQQLMAGSRALDLRIQKKGGVPRCYHGDYKPLGGYGHRCDEFLPQIDSFLDDHPGEIVIVRISHTKESVGVHNLVLDMIDGDRLLKCGPRNLATLPLSKLRGKAIVIFDKKALAKTRPMQGLHRLHAYAAKKTLVKNTPGEGLPICGQYAGKDAKQPAIVKVAREFGNHHGNHDLKQNNKHDHLFMIYWQQAMNVEKNATKGSGERLKALAKMDKDKGVHYNLDYLLNLHRGLPYVSKGPGKLKKNEVGILSNITLSNRAVHRPNWINLDFICDSVVQKVIEFNTEMMPGGRGW